MTRRPIDPVLQRIRSDRTLWGQWILLREYQRSQSCDTMAYRLRDRHDGTGWQFRSRRPDWGGIYQLLGRYDRLDHTDQ